MCSIMNLIIGRIFLIEFDGPVRNLATEIVRVLVTTSVVNIYCEITYLMASVYSFARYWGGSFLKSFLKRKNSC